MARVLVVGECSGTTFQRATLSAITAARQAIAILGGGFDVLLLGGPGTEAAAQGLRGYGAGRVLFAEHESLSAYLGERFSGTVAMTAQNYDLVVATATDFGKDLMPRVAGKLDAAYAGDCLEFVARDGDLHFRRALYAGNAFAFVSLQTAVRVLTIRQCEFEPAPLAGGSSPIESLGLAPPDRAWARIELVGRSTPARETPPLAEAKAIVAGGRGLKLRFFEMLEPLAHELGAVLGASRAACDSGFAPSEFQVGQTGAMVAPGLYVAVGVSGALQHLAGMKRSKIIVAINKDPEAPIFRVADYGLVANLFDAVPALVEALRRRRGDPTAPTDHASAPQSDSCSAKAQS